MMEHHLLPTFLEVEGVGAVRLPLSEHDLMKLERISEHAPYGHGRRTLLDASVRKALQIDASKVSAPFLDQSGITEVAAQALDQLGLDKDAIELKLYKLLIYRAGGHFKLHRDTEKEPGMFGTLILQMPTYCGHEGGRLVVRHGKATKSFGFSRESSLTKFYQVAFYADCEHELEEVDDGVRLCLAFNMVHAPRRQPTDTSAGLGRTKAALVKWLESVDAEPETTPLKLGIALSHKYTSSNISFAHLKGEDRVVVGLLQACAEELSLELCLCLLTRHKVCQGDDVFEDETTTSDWVNNSGDRKVNISLRVSISKEVVGCKDEEDGWPKIQPFVKEAATAYVKGGSTCFPLTVLAILGVGGGQDPHWN